MRTLRLLPLLALLAVAPSCTLIGGAIGLGASGHSTHEQRRQNVITGIVLGALADAVTIAALSTIELPEGQLLPVEPD